MPSSHLRDRILLDMRLMARNTAQRRAGRGHALLMRPAKPRPGVPFVGVPLCAGPIRTTGALSGSDTEVESSNLPLLIEGYRRSDQHRCSDAVASNDASNAPPIMPCCQDAMWPNDECGSRGAPRDPRNVSGRDHHRPRDRCEMLKGQRAMTDEMPNRRC